MFDSDKISDTIKFIHCSCSIITIGSMDSTKSSTTLSSNSVYLLLSIIRKHYIIFNEYVKTYFQIFSDKSVCIFCLGLQCLKPIRHTSSKPSSEVFQIHICILMCLTSGCLMFLIISLFCFQFNLQNSLSPQSFS